MKQTHFTSTLHRTKVCVELGYERRSGEDEGKFFNDFPKKRFSLRKDVAQNCLPISRNRNSLAFSTERLFESTHAPYFFGTTIDMDSLFRGPMKEM